MPTNPIEPIQDRVVASSFHCTARAAMTNEMRPTSMASSAQPTPDPTSTFAWARVKGRRSSRSERVSGAVMGAFAMVWRSCAA